MAYLPDEDGQEEWQRDRWLHEYITVSEPFAQMFRLEGASRYDLLAKFENALKLPRRDFQWSTERFIDKLYRTIVDAWRCGTAVPDRSHARGFVKVALWHVKDHELDELVRDFDWSETLFIPAKTAHADIRTEVEKVVERWLGERVENLLRRLRRTGKTSAA